MRRFALAAASVVAALMAPATAGAITYGSPGGDAPPSVGGLVSATQYGDGTWLYCSGTLISPTVFLTAAHCAEGDRVGVTFDPAYQQGDTVYYGSWHADPRYRKAQSDPHDIAVVTFPRPIAGITPARLPAARSPAAPPPTPPRPACPRPGRWPPCPATRRSRRSATGRSRWPAARAAISSSTTT